MKIRYIGTAALLSCALLFSGCTNTPATDVSHEPASSDISSAAQSSVPEAKKHYITLSKNESYDISAGDNPRKFSSADANIASVNSSGTVTGVSEGKTEISVISDEIVTDIYIVTVNKSVYEQSLPSAPESSEGEENRITPAVWEVTTTGGNTVYMMGSIHVGDTDIFYMPDYYNAAFSRCSALAVECDTTKLDLLETASYIDKYLYTDGTMISDHVSEKAYNNAKEILKKYGRYTSQTDRYKPMLWTQYLEICSADEIGLSSDYGVESIVMAEASKKGKQILELESVQFQMQLLTSFDDRLQEALFETYANDDTFDKAVKSMDEMYSKWKSGTLTAEDVGAETDYSEYYSDNMTAEEHAEADELKKLYEDYNKKMLDDRNAGMEKKIKGYLDDGKTVMVVVGSGHFYGDNGIISLLEKDGCTVKSLSSADTSRLKAQ